MAITSITSINNISFKGCSCCGSAEPPLFSEFPENPVWISDIINASIREMKQGDVLVCALREDDAGNLLSANKHKITTAIKDIYFIDESLTDFPFALYKDNNGRINIVDFAPLECGNISVNDNVLNGNRVELKQGDSIIALQVGDQAQVFKLDLNTDAPKSYFEKYAKKISNYKPADSKFMKLFYPNADLLNKSPFQIKNQILFKDIGGQDKNIEELETNIIFPFKYPEFFDDLRLNKCVLLYGPPRCGKTMLANALANEMGINFIKLSADDITEAYVGKTEENWRRIFSEALESQPCMIFIDEFDGIARQRSESDKVGRNNTVNQLLTLLSDLEKSDDKVFVVAATNRRDMIDKAFLQTGRFGLQLEVKEPDIEGIKQIYDIHAKSKFLDSNIDKDAICELMYNAGFNGSDVVEIFTLGRICALKRSGLYDLMKTNRIKSTDSLSFKITQQDLADAIEKISRQKKDLS